MDCIPPIVGISLGTAVACELGSELEYERAVCVGLGYGLVAEIAIQIKVDELCDLISPPKDKK